MSETTAYKNIYQKLLVVQQRVNGLGKNGKGFGYQYVTGDKILYFLKPIMNELGLLLKQEVLSIENTRQDYKTKGGDTSELNSKVMMRFTWVDCETGQTDENLFGANGQNAWDKGVGSALTYAERYFLLKYFHIPTDEDDIDNPERKPQEAAKPQPPREKAQPVAEAEALEAFITSEQKDTIIKLLSHPLITNDEKGKMLKNLGKMDTARADAAIKKLRETHASRATVARQTLHDLIVDAENIGDVADHYLNIAEKGEIKAVLETIEKVRELLPTNAAA